jgi:NAD(P)-dependent dehydrogenase (short-subunit alcohol dehydrogenase family)
MVTRALAICGRCGIGGAAVRALAARGMAVTYTFRTVPADFGEEPVIAPPRDLSDRDEVEAFAQAQLDAPAGTPSFKPGAPGSLVRTT